MLFMPMSGGRGLGPVTRCLAVAEQAAIMGHEVAFFCKPDFQQYVMQLGFPCYQAPIPVRTKNVKAQMFRLSDVAVALGMTQESYIRESVVAELLAIEDFNPDVIFSETQLTAPISAKKAGVKIASTAPWPDHPQFCSPLYQELPPIKDYADGFNRVLREFGQETIEDAGELAYLRSDLKIAPTHPSLEPALLDIPNLHYTGPLLYKGIELRNIPEWLHHKKQKHRVLVYLSYSDISPQKYLRVIPSALEGTGWEAIVVCNHHEITELPNGTEHCCFVRSVPGMATMRTASAVLFHGGQNTAMSSLLSGVPSLIFPGSNAEMDFHARYLEREGSGVRMSVDAFTPELVLESLNYLIKGEHRARAKVWGDKLRQLGGPQEAVRLMQQLYQKQMNEGDIFVSSNGRI